MTADKKPGDAFYAFADSLPSPPTMLLVTPDPFDAGVISDMDQPIALLPAEYDRVVALLDAPGEPTEAMRTLFAASTRQPVAGWGVDGDGSYYLDAGWLSAQVEPTGAWEVYVETTCRGCDDINDIDAILDGQEDTLEAAQLAAEDAIREITTASSRMVACNIGGEDFALNCNMQPTGEALPWPKDIYDRLQAIK